MTVEGSGLRRSVLRAFLWMGTGTAVVQLISWLSTIITVRLLSPSDYGLIAMTTVFTGLIATVGESGIGSALVQIETLTERETRQTFAWVLITGLLGFTVAWSFAPGVARFYDQPQLIALIRVVAVSGILVVFYVVPQSLFVREMNFKVRAKIEIAAQLGSVLLTLICALQGLGVWSLVAGLMALHGIKVVAYHTVRPTWTKPLFDLRGSHRLVKYGTTMTADRLLNFMYQESDKIIIGRVLGNTLLGVYSVAMGVSAIPLQRVLPLITQVSFASYARIQGDVERIRRNVLRSTRATALAGFPFFFGMSAVAPLGIPLVLGTKWASVVVPVQLICLVLPLKALASILTTVLQAMGRPAISFVNIAIVAFGMAAAFLVGVRFGLVGVCVAWLVVYPVLAFITTVRALRAIDLPLGRYLAELRFPLVASAVMMAGVHLLMRTVVMPRPIYSLVTMVFLGIVFYSGLVLVFKRDEYSEFLSLLRR